MRITPKLLEDHDACSDQVELFRRWLGDRSYCLLTARNVKLAAQAGLDVEWLFENVDMEPSDDTLAAACGDAQTAYFYALCVDRQPRDDTRAAACGDAETAYEYALHVDKQPQQRRYVGST